VRVDICFEKPYEITSEDQMYALGQEFARTILAESTQERIVTIGIDGPYNSGKSTFTKGVASIIAPDWEKPNLAKPSAVKLSSHGLFVHFDKQGSQKTYDGFLKGAYLGASDFYNGRFTHKSYTWYEGLAVIEHSGLSRVDYNVEINSADVPDNSNMDYFLENSDRARTVTITDNLNMPTAP